GPEKKAVSMLLDEVEKRTHIRLHTATEWPLSDSTVIAVGQPAALKEFAAKVSDLPTTAEPAPAEGYRIRVQIGADIQLVSIVGNDPRGVLFGIGRLLRELQMSPGSVTLDDHFTVASAPKYPLRGHQLGY